MKIVLKPLLNKLDDIDIAVEIKATFTVLQAFEKLDSFTDLTIETIKIK